MSWSLGWEWGSPVVLSCIKRFVSLFYLLNTIFCTKHNLYLMLIFTVNAFESYGIREDNCRTDIESDVQWCQQNWWCIQSFQWNWIFRVFNNHLFVKLVCILCPFLGCGTTTDNTHTILTLGAPVLCLFGGTDSTLTIHTIPGSDG
jgi:hypothetical protein